MNRPAPFAAFAALGVLLIAPILAAPVMREDALELRAWTLDAAEAARARLRIGLWAWAVALIA